MPLQSLQNFDLYPLNTFAVHARARQAFVIESLADLCEWRQLNPG